MAGEWEEVSVAELQAAGALLVEDGNHGENRPRPDEFSTEGIQFIRAADMDSGRVLFERAQRINEVARQRVRKGIGAGGDVLLSHKGTVGKVAYVPLDAPPFVCSPQTTFWRVKDLKQLDRRYIYFYLLSRAFREQLDSRKGETDMADYVSLTTQRTLKVTVPPLAEQKAIAAVLGALDDKIELNRRMNATLEAMARALFQSWFVDFDPVRAKLDGRRPVGMGAETAALFPNTFERCDGELLPTGWRKFTLEDAMESIIDYRGKTPTKTESGVPLVTAKIVKDGRVLPFGEFIADDDYEAWMRRGIPKVGDIVMTTEAPLGEVAQLDDRRVALAQRVITLRGKPGVLENACLRFLMQSPTFQTDLHARASGTTVVGIRQSELRKIPLFLPPVAEQTAFAKLVVPMTQQMDRNWLQCETLSRIRDTLLPKLLSGELSVSGAGQHAMYPSSVRYRNVRVTLEFNKLFSEQAAAAHEAGHAVVANALGIGTAYCWISSPSSSKRWTGEHMAVLPTEEINDLHTQQKYAEIWAKMAVGGFLAQVFYVLGHGELLSEKPTFQDDSLMTAFLRSNLRREESPGDFEIVYSGQNYVVDGRVFPSEDLKQFNECMDEIPNKTPMKVLKSVLEILVTPTHWSEVIRLASALTGLKEIEGKKCLNQSSINTLLGW